MAKIIAESHHIIESVTEVESLKDAEIGFYLLFTFVCGDSALSTLFFYPSKISLHVKRSFLGKSARVVHFDNQKVAVLVKP